MLFVEAPSSFAAWRESARELLRADVPPGEIFWTGASASQGGLFTEAGAKAPEQSSKAVPKEFLRLAAVVSCHRDAQRWPLLYRMLYRLTHGERHLLKIETDPDVCEAVLMERSVRRDMHKMKAFVRFRKIEREGYEEFVAWHRPDHLIVEKMAPWFVDRFGSMRWSILTPECSAYWDLESLRFGPGVPQRDAPQADALEELWRSYYASVFNPARLKVRAMKSEMAVRYWAALPEAKMIPGLIREASSRETEMREKQVGSAAAFIPESNSLPVLSKAVQACKGCDLYQFATQAVFGEGPRQAAVMFVGEQPGDQEDRQGKPFVGPAGQMLDRAMEEAGLDRAAIYVTNAVKHFKFEERGKRRLHKPPRAGEVAACQPWLEAEIEIVKPKILVALGATAALSLIGREFRITRDRGVFFPHHAVEAFFATVHPSYLLRIPEPERKQSEYAQFVADLKKIKDRLAA